MNQRTNTRTSEKGAPKLQLKTNNCLNQKIPEEKRNQKIKRILINRNKEN